MDSRLTICQMRTKQVVSPKTNMDRQQTESSAKSVERCFRNAMSPIGNKIIVGCGKMFALTVAMRRGSHWSCNFRYTSYIIRKGWSSEEFLKRGKRSCSLNVDVWSSRECSWVRLWKSPIRCPRKPSADGCASRGWRLGQDERAINLHHRRWIVQTLSSLEPEQNGRKQQQQ
ncbi:hypothetical protein RP20_CCG011919 [Aedes albopictus]|nr:hypothetical protein RP20_CCG011919 [Aedes albopictus]